MAENNFKNETEFVFSSEFAGFTTIPNYILNDRSISFKALGLYAQILQFQNSAEHKIYVKSLQQLKTDGRDSVTAGLNELIKAGYIVREQLHDAKGKMSGVKYIVYMKPCPPKDVTENGKPVSGIPDSGKPATYKENKVKKKIDNKENKKTTPTASSSNLNSDHPTANEIEIYEAFKNSLGKEPNVSVKLQIRGILAHQETELVVAAIQMAAQNNKEWNYAKGILSKWKAKGILTISRYLAEEGL